jgi:hypothetical protein
MHIRDYAEKSSRRLAESISATYLCWQCGEFLIYDCETPKVSEPGSLSRAEPFCHAPQAMQTSDQG